MYWFAGGITYGITPVWGTWYDPPTRVGIFCATPHSVDNENAHILHSSSHFIYHQYNYGPVNHDGLDGQFHISGFTKEGRNIGTWSDPITRVGFISESWAERDSFSIIVGSMHIIYVIMTIIKILEMKDYLLAVILLVLEV